MAIALSGSLVITGSIFATQGITGSFSGNATSASYADTLQGLGSASFAPAATFNTVSQSFATTSGSLSTRVTNLESTSSTVSSSFASTSGSIAGRVTLIEGQYATTGSNTFTGPQYVSQASNAISFTSTASLYTDGGLRVSKDSFVSGTAYFNNVVVYGTSSIQYITSSQVNFGTNIITVNTDTPAVRFGGLAVFDSGSTQLTGSMLWDSEKNHWIYSNPSGSTYNSAMLMNGPRNTGSLGTEQGTTACAMMIGQGGDHITSSMIYSYDNATCFYGTTVIGSGGTVCTAMGNFACVGIGTTTPTYDLTLSKSVAAGNVVLNIENTSTTGAARLWLGNNASSTGARIQYFGATHAARPNLFSIGTDAANDMMFETSGTERARITSTGIACFACQVCANSTGGISGTFRSSTFFGSIDLENTGGDVAGKWNVQSVSGAQIGGSPGSSFGIYSYGASAYRLFINSSGNVGIGTTSPSTALEVSSADLNNIFVTNPTTTGTTTGSGIGFKAYNGTSVAQAAGIILTSNTWSFGTYSANQLSIGSDGTGGLALRTANSAPITFFTGCTTAGLSAERVRITSTGVVGIGTNAPVIDDGNLVVAGCVGTGQGAANTVAQINIWETVSANKSGLWFGSMTNANTGVIGSRTATGNIAFQTYCGAWAERMRITYNGNVGIGNTSPLTKLTVNNAVVGAILPYIQGTGLSYNNDGISVAGSNTNNTNIGNGLTLYNNVASVGAYGPVVAWSSMTAGGAYNATYAFITGVYGGTGGDTNWAIGDLILGTAESYGATERMRIRNNGNVGINNSSPSYRLDICTAQSIRVIGSSTGYTQGSIIFQSSTTDAPEARGLGVYAFNEGTDATWFYGTAYNAADSFVVNRKSGTTYQDAAASVGEACNFLLINNTGKVGIGTTNLSTEANLFLGAQGANEGGQLVLQKGTSCSCATHLDNYQDSFRIISGTNTGSTTVNMSINHTNGIASFGSTVCAPIITSNANSVSLTGIVLLTTLATDNALYIITAQPEAGSGTSAAALVTSRTNQNPSVQTIVSSSSLSFVTSGYNICLCSNLAYGISARWGIIRLA